MTTQKKFKVIVPACVILREAYDFGDSGGVEDFSEVVSENERLHVECDTEDEFWALLEELYGSDMDCLTDEKWLDEGHTLVALPQFFVSAKSMREDDLYIRIVEAEYFPLFADIEDEGGAVAEEENDWEYSLNEEDLSNIEAREAELACV